MARLKWRELTYRTVPEDPRYFREMAERLVGRRVVIWVQSAGEYRRAWLISTNGPKDTFVIRWRRKERTRKLKGLWKIHNPGLFTEFGLPEPRGRATVVQATNPFPKEGIAVATTKRGSKRASAKKAAENGGRTRRDVLEEYTEAERKRMAKQIFKMKKSGASWGEIAEELDLPGDRPSVAGRRLLREYMDGGEEVIRERNVSTKAKSRKVVDEDDEDEDEDEDEAPAPKRGRKRVTTTRGRKRNP